MCFYMISSSVSYVLVSKITIVALKACPSQYNIKFSTQFFLFFASSPKAAPKIIFTYVPLLFKRVILQVYIAIRIQLAKQKSDLKSKVSFLQSIIRLYYLSYRIPSTIRQYLSFIINIQRFSIYQLIIRVIYTILVITPNSIIRLLITLRFRSFFNI